MLGLLATHGQGQQGSRRRAREYEQLHQRRVVFRLFGGQGGAGLVHRE